MARSLTRKQVKQPDEFITLAQRAWTWVGDHLTRVLAMIGVTVLIIGAAWVWNHYALRRAETNTTLLSRAIELEDPALAPAGVAGATEDGSTAPSVKSERERLAAAETAFGRAVDEVRGRRPQAIALLMRAGVRYRSGRYRQAQADYARFLRDADDETTRFFGTAATEGLMYCHEAQRQWPEALRAVARLPREGDARFVALYHEGRLLLGKGDRRGAEERLRQVVSGAKSRSLVERASQALTALRDAA